MFWLCVFFYSKFKNNQLFDLHRENQPVSSQKTRIAVLSKMGNSELTLPILTSPPDVALSDLTVSINHIFLPKTKIFQIVKRMWQGFEKNFQESSKTFWMEARESVLTSHCWAEGTPHLRGLGTSGFMRLGV